MFEELEDEFCDDDYGDEDDMAKIGAITDESAVESDERHKDSDPANDFRSSFSSASSISQSESSDSFQNVSELAPV